MYFLPTVLLILQIWTYYSYHVLIFDSYIVVVFKLKTINVQAYLVEQVGAYPKTNTNLNCFNLDTIILRHVS